MGKKNTSAYMTKSQLIQVISEKHKKSKAVATVIINSILNSIITALQNGQRVEIRGFGTFELRHYDAYQGRNPQTGEKISVKAKTLPFFKIGKFKSELSNKKN